MLGGTFALAIGATLMYVHFSEILPPIRLTLTSNNTLRSSMERLSMPEELIIRIINDPALLSNPTLINLSADQATSILEHGYTRGFRLVFILNASLSAVATVTSIVMIKHKNLTRDDEEKLRREAKGITAGGKEEGDIVSEQANDKLDRSGKVSSDELHGTMHDGLNTAENTPSNVSRSFIEVDGKTRKQL